MTPAYRVTTTRLLAEFGTLAEVLAASRAEQSRAAGGDRRVSARLQAIARLLDHVTRDRITGRDALRSFGDVKSYLSLRLRDRRVEEVRALYLDSANGLIRDDLVTRGTVDEAIVYPRALVGRALQLGASGMIIAHNHPSGSPEPSGADIAMTKRVDAASRALGITLHDHLVIAATGITSFRDKGLL